MPRFVRPATPLSELEEAQVWALSMPLAQAIVHELALRGPLQHGELVRATGASPMAVTKHLVALEDLGLIAGNIPRNERARRRVQYTVVAPQVRATLRVLENYLLPEEGSPPLLGDVKSRSTAPL